MTLRPHLAVLTASILVLPALLSAQFQGDTEALEEVVQLARTNRDAIVTWSGEAEIRRQVIGQDEQPRLVRTVRFWEDNDRGISCSDVIQPGPVPIRHTDRDGQVHDIELRQVRTLSARTGDALFVRTVWDPHEGRPPSIDTHDPLPHGTPAMQDQWPPARNVFVPEAHFSALNNDTTDMMASLLASRDRVRVSITVQRKQNLVFILLRAGMGGNLYTFDLDQAGCLVEFSAGRQDGEGTTSLIEVEYSRIDDVFVLLRWRRERQFAVIGEDQRRHVIDDIVFSDTQVNEPIDPSRFTFAALGAEEGESVRDLRDDRTYTYRIGRDVDLNQLLDEPLPDQSR